MEEVITVPVMVKIKWQEGKRDSAIERARKLAGERTAIYSGGYEVCVIGVSPQGAFLSLDELEEIDRLADCGASDHMTAPGVCKDIAAIIQAKIKEATCPKQAKS